MPWNQASFAEGVAVTIRGTYTPVLPTLLLMPSAISVTITGVTGGEG